VVPDTQEAEVGGLRSEFNPRKSTRPSKKQTKAKRARGMVRMVACLPSKHKV
jgi:hypothetical protein